MSKLVSCPDCGESVSRKADSCPKCGREIRGSFAKRMFRRYLWFLLFMTLLMGWCVVA